MDISASDLPRLSPQPERVKDTESCIMSLNGTWTFQTNGIKESPIEVPGEWAMQDFEVPEGETAVYTRMFDLPDDWTGKRIKILFDGVSSYGSVKVNGKDVGEHEGGMVPFELDITDAVRKGSNELRVDVKAWTISDRMGCISQYATHTVGGLVRKVTLFALPETNVASTDAVTLLDKNHENAVLRIHATVAYEGTQKSGAVAEYELTNEDGKIVGRTRVKVGSKNTADAVIKVKNARLWDPEQPYLYQLRTKLYVNGSAVQENVRRVGLRQVEIRGNKLTVNGRPVKLKGVNRHEVHPLRGRSLTPELCRRDAELFRAGNCNYIRTSHYPPSEEFLDACDELGLFVECESALTWIQHHASPIWKEWDYLDEKFLPYMMRANADNIAANRHHPSVIVWSPGNESRWSPLWEKVTKAIKEWDSSRPVCFHDQCTGDFNNAGSRADIANYHYPGINDLATFDTMSRPVLFGEYAHLSCYNRAELVTDPGVRAAYGKPLVQMYDAVYNADACIGGALWSGIDDIFHLSDGRISGYGPWGVIDGWRRTKPEYTAMKHAYAPVRIKDAKFSKDKDGKSLMTLTIENRYDFTDLSMTKIEVGREGEKTEPVTVRLAPRKTETFTMPVSGPEYLNAYVRVTDPRGFVCAEEIIGDSDYVSMALYYPVDVVETEDAVIVTLEDQIADAKDRFTRYVIAKETGLITHAVVKGKTVLTQGPVFCVVPMNADDGGKPNVAGETYQGNIYPVKNYPMYTLFAEKIVWRKERNRVIVEVNASYHRGAEGKLIYYFSPDDAGVRLDYEVTLGEDVRPRQYGMLFQLPPSMRELRWDRRGEFSVYPADDIARLRGTAVLNARPLYETEAWRETPRGNWKDDANILGSIDFRSSKKQIKEARLTDGDGNGIRVRGRGEQTVRAWLQDGRIQFLVADYDNTGSEPFYGKPFTNERITLKKGQTVKGSVMFELIW